LLPDKEFINLFMGKTATKRGKEEKESLGKEKLFKGGGRSLEVNQAAETCEARCRDELYTGLSAQRGKGRKRNSQQG